MSLFAELDLQLQSEDDELLQRALLRVAELIDDWRSNSSAANPSLVLNSEKARDLIRSRIIESIDRGPTRPVAAVAVWVLGKLFDHSLEPYFAQLALIYVKDDVPQNLWQVVIALDNLEMIPEFSEMPDRYDAVALSRVVADYLARRHGNGNTP